MRSDAVSGKRPPASGFGDDLLPIAEDRIPIDDGLTFIDEADKPPTVSPSRPQAAAATPPSKGAWESGTVIDTSEPPPMGRIGEPAVPKHRQAKSGNDHDLNDIAELMGGDVADTLPAAAPIGDYQKRIAIWTGIGAVVAILLLLGLNWLLHGRPQPPAPAPPPVASARPNPRPEPFASLPVLPAEPAALPLPAPIPIELAANRPAWAGLQAFPSASANRVTLSDTVIEDSIRRGADFLIGQFQGNRLINADRQPTEQLAGLQALATQALLYASSSVDDPRLNIDGPFMSGLLDELVRMPMDNNFATYSRSIRLSALGQAMRLQDTPVMQADLQYLLNASNDGAFGYRGPQPNNPPGPWDNSNSQYGVLGVWAAADAGLAVPSSFWDAVERHWTRSQRPDGGWVYRADYPNPNSAQTMTTAGITSQFLASQRPGSRDSAPSTRGMSDSLQRGLDWLEQGDRAITPDIYHPGYAMYGIERAGLASGYRLFGSHDWFVAMAPEILASQKPDGSWKPTGDGVVAETAFRMLFLSRGSHPILATKLRYDGAWANRPNDLHDLARFASRQLERAMNWQVVPVKQDWTNWTGSPLLVISSDAAPSLDDDDRENIRQFVYHGGMVFTHAEKGSAAFNAFAQSLAAELFPGRPLIDAPADHPLYSVFARPKTAYPLKIVQGGGRLFMVHSPVDLSVQWDKWEPKKRAAPPGLELGLNVAIYAGGKTPPRSRLSTTLEAQPQLSAIGVIPVALLKHDGDWNAEPAAWDNFGRWFLRQTSIAISPEPVEIAALNRRSHPLAHLSDTTAFELSPESASQLTAYVKSGGVLVLDNCGGGKDAANAIRTKVLPALGVGLPTPFTSTHPLLQVGPSEVTRVEARITADEDPTSILPPQVFAVGNGFVVSFERDLTTALLGSSVWDIRGYTPSYARPLIRNLLLAVSDRGAREQWAAQ